jgi:hypothetical protein
VGQLNGIKAIVTGGASGIGLAIVQAFVAETTSVVVLGRAAEPPADLPGGTGYVRADISDDAVRRAVAVGVDRLGGLDVRANNAGIRAQGTVDTDDEWHRVLDVNVAGTARVSRAARPHLRQSDRRGERGVDRGDRRAAAAGDPLGPQGRGALAHPGDGRRRYPGQSGESGHGRHAVGRLPVRQCSGSGRRAGGAWGAANAWAAGVRRRDRVCLLAADYGSVMTTLAPALDRLRPAERKSVRDGTAAHWYAVAGVDDTAGPNGTAP